VRVQLRREVGEAREGWVDGSQARMKGTQGVGEDVRRGRPVAILRDVRFSSCYYLHAPHGSCILVPSLVRCLLPWS